MRMFSDSNDLTNNIESKVYEGLLLAIEQNKKEAFRAIKSFVIQIINDSIHKNSVLYFNQYIQFPVLFYSFTQNLRGNESTTVSDNEYRESSARVLKDIIWLSIDYKFQDSQKIDELLLKEQYYSRAFTQFNKLLYLTTRCKDLQHFRYTLGELRQIRELDSNSIYNLKHELRIESDNLKKDELQLRFQCLTRLSMLKKHTYLGVSYWLYFLYQTKVLSQEELKAFEKEIRENQRNTYCSLFDILYIRTSSRDNYLGWNDWDFTERQSGVAYGPPSPSNWCTLGFVIEIIKGKILRPLTENLDNTLLSEVKHLKENVKAQEEKLIENFDYWKGVLRVSDSGEVSRNLKPLYDTLNHLKREELAEEEKEIASLGLSESKIIAFKKLIGETWLNSRFIPQLFREYENYETILNEDEKLLKSCQKIFFKKAKFQFIDGEHFRDIFGIERLGDHISQGENEMFYSIVMSHVIHKFTNSNLVDLLHDLISSLKKKNIVPNLIIVPTQILDYDNEVRQSPFFVPVSNQSEVSNVKIGMFDNIPIYSVWNDMIDNKVLVADMNKAFLHRYKENEEWFNKELKIEVTEVSDKQAEGRLKDEYEEWTTSEGEVKLSDKDALTLIKTSVNINIETILDYQVLDTEAYAIGFLKPKDD